MDITFSMTDAEFLEFMEWKKDKETYSAKLAAMAQKWDIMAKKTCWAIAEDPKKPGKVKIVDQEHAAELLDMANDYLA